MRKLANQNLERPRLRRQTRNTPKETDLTWFGQSTYVHKGDEQSTINMRVQNIERNNFKQFTRNTRRYTKFSSITATLKTLGLHCEC
uniref:Putative ovule protein n=1 Tax=Solanum chacoense TaxID=4108 RepID=A0A0V0HP82_SOLCH